MLSSSARIKKLSKTVSISLIVLLLVLNSGKDYLHNHSFSEEKNEDCLVLLLNQALLSGLIDQSTVIGEKITLYIFFVSEIEEVDNSDIDTFNLRAPPTV